MYNRYTSEHVHASHKSVGVRYASLRMQNGHMRTRQSIIRITIFIADIYSVFT